ncbi:hypothetical protein AB0K43_15635 [Kitasatospora sp. NPDC049258]|uniref:WXG100 family type VII secretion target n=1 Tax=Kitasatospora sp. NPDC049258 TaxID=3155394 RepID=UPI00342F1581
MSEFTNFHGYSHGDMRSMVQSMDSGGVMAASDPWRKATETLKQIHGALNVASADATSSWEGSTSDAFYSKMTKLANAVNNAAAYANDAAAAMQMMSEAIDTAKRDMPEEPSWWDKAGDAISDTAKSTVGADDEDTRTAISDEKKAQAVGVMETLAAKYRATTNYLKPPRKTDIGDEIEDLQPPDSGGAAALGALIMGGGMGFAGAGQSKGGVAPTPRSSGPAIGGSTTSPKPAKAGPTDPGIKGGIANSPAKPASPGPSGPGTGIDGVHVGTTAPKGNVLPQGGGSGGSGVNSGGHAGGIAGGVDVRGGGAAGGAGGRGGSSTGGQRGQLGGSGAGSGAGRSIGGAGGSARGGANAFGAGGMEGGHAKGAGAGAGGGAGADRRTSSGLVRKGGGLVGEAGKNGSGRQAFTEGGSGLGRSRGQGGPGADGAANGMPGGSRGGKKDKKQAKDRPDYLVEDEETWASGERVNPDVVE